MAARLCQGMENITLTMKEQRRMEIMPRVFRGELTVGEAAMERRISSSKGEKGVKSAVDLSSNNSRSF
jgi:hypothetical protein